VAVGPSYAIKIITATGLPHSVNNSADGPAAATAAAGGGGGGGGGDANTTGTVHRRRCCRNTRRCQSLRAQVHEACPQTLLPVLPLLSQELGLEDESRRLAAVQLLGALFAIPGSELDQEYFHVFADFLRRFTDQKVLNGLGFSMGLWIVCQSVQHFVIGNASNLARQTPVAAGKVL